jgi:nicotinamide mononucleotide (NMN) deamidase PncC
VDEINKVTDDILNQVHKINATSQQIVLATTGSGHSAVSWLLSSTEAYRTMLEVIIPYSSKAVTSFLGFEPKELVSQETAWEMALKAYNIAMKETNFPIGVGCTTDINQISHTGKVIISVWTPAKTLTFTSTLAKNKRTTDEEERFISYLILIAISQGINLENKELKISILPGDLFEREEVLPPR